jgi:hypothetical protein
MVPITSSAQAGLGLLSPAHAWKSKPAANPTVLKRQDLAGLLKSDLRGKTQTCAIWRSCLRDRHGWGAAEGENGGCSKSDSTGHH